ncbi:ribonuclease III [Propioniciclava sinopodophylli]|uniref:ribonuclease III n=1 Tax=Propioniciclava sinopodophylli TaxID=1837344 RepID=UPI001F4FBD90|nr:ribonuclease III [Propioniciclava sinopodophylli]
MTDAAVGRVHDLFDELGIDIDPQLLELALTHRSWAYENGGTPHNERLEFLGDSVLGVVVTEHLYRSYPDEPEGWLAKMRAAVVNTYALADVARTLGLGSLIKLGKGEIGTGGSDKDSILADATEAVIAAVFLSAGRDAAERFVHTLMDPVVAMASAEGRSTDWKTALQELAAEHGLGAPTYEHVSTGPDHDKRFEAVAVVAGVAHPGSVARSKKLAEQGAAKLAHEALTRTLAPLPPAAG